MRAVFLGMQRAGRFFFQHRAVRHVFVPRHPTVFQGGALIAGDHRRSDGDRRHLKHEGNRSEKAGAIANEPHDQTLWSSRMPNNVKARRSIFLVAATIASITSVEAQIPSAAGWRWSLNGNIFAGLNYQHRRFDDLRTVESQNWFMGQGERPLGRGQLRIHTMFSLEPFTLKKLGSPQARPRSVRRHSCIAHRRQRIRRVRWRIITSTLSTSRPEYSRWAFHDRESEWKDRGSTAGSRTSAALISTLVPSTPGRYVEPGRADHGARSCRARGSTSLSRCIRAT